MVSFEEHSSIMHLEARLPAQLTDTTRSAKNIPSYVGASIRDLNQSDSFCCCVRAVSRQSELVNVRLTLPTDSSNAATKTIRLVEVELSVGKVNWSMYGSGGTPRVTTA